MERESIENFHQELREKRQKGPSSTWKSIASRQRWQEQQRRKFGFIKRTYLFLVDGLTLACSIPAVNSVTSIQFLSPFFNVSLTTTPPKFLFSPYFTVYTTNHLPLSLYPLAQPIYFTYNVSEDTKIYLAVSFP